MAATNELQSVQFTPSNFIRSHKNLYRQPAMIALGFVIPKGTTMGYASTGANAGFYVPYALANTDGSQIPVGFLAYDVDSSAATGENRNVDTVIYTRGIFYYSYLAALNLDANALTVWGAALAILASDNTLMLH